MNSCLNKPIRPANNSQASHGFRTQMKIGRDIANQLPEVKSVAQVAAEMDLSPVMVRRIECRALYKLAMMIRAARAAGDL